MTPFWRIPLLLPLFSLSLPFVSLALLLSLSPQSLFTLCSVSTCHSLHLTPSSPWSGISHTLFPVYTFDPTTALHEKSWWLRKRFSSTNHRLYLPTSIPAHYHPSTQATGYYFSAKFNSRYITRIYPSPSSSDFFRPPKFPSLDYSDIATVLHCTPPYDAAHKELGCLHYEDRSAALRCRPAPFWSRRRFLAHALHRPNRPRANRPSRQPGTGGSPQPRYPRWKE